MAEFEETTNAVLKEKIEGLTKLTDERFSVVKDSLARIEHNQSSFALKTELEEVKRDFGKTVDILNTLVGKLSIQIFGLQKFIWMAGGVIALITFLAPVLFHRFGWF